MSGQGGVDEATGEVRAEEPATLRTWVPIRDRAEQLVAERPEDPAAVADVMYRIEQMLVEIAEYLAKVNNERYETERAHARRFHSALAKHAERHSITVSRSLATTDAEPEKAEHDAKRALFHYAQDTQKALMSKHFGLMNINKNMASVMFQRGSRS